MSAKDHDHSNKKLMNYQSKRITENTRHAKIMRNSMDTENTEHQRDYTGTRFFFFINSIMCFRTR